MAAETQYTANTGMVTISTANTSLTGGTLNTNIFTVLTAGAVNGTLLKTVKIKSQGTPNPTTQGMIRLFVYDGANQRLLKEIDVDPIYYGAPDISFEKTVTLNFKLQRNWSLLVSSQTNDTFNIIAEGLDFTYFNNYVRPESTNYSANTGIATISTAATSMTGTGSTPLLTPTNGYNGTAIESITIKAAGATPSDGVIRFFIYNTNNSTYYLFTEVFVPYYSQSGTYQSFEHVITFPDKFQLAYGYNLYVSTSVTISTSFAIVVEAMDWNYPGGAISNFTPPTPVTTVSATPTVLHALFVPKSFVFSGGLFQVYANIATNNSANNKTYAIYQNTSSSYSSGSPILLGTYVTANLTGDNISRLFPIISDTVVECYGGTGTTTQNEYATTAGTSANSSTLTSISAGFWILITAQISNAGDSAGLRWSMVRKIF